MGAQRGNGFMRLAGLLATGDNCVYAFFRHRRRLLHEVVDASIAKCFCLVVGLSLGACVALEIYLAVVCCSRATLALGDELAAVIGSGSGVLVALGVGGVRQLFLGRLGRVGRTGRGVGILLPLDSFGCSLGKDLLIPAL